MRFAVLSDTHAGDKKAEEVFESLRPHLADVQGILHAGDITSPLLLQMLRTLAPLYAVAGNMDGEDIRQELREREILELGDHRIGLIHGWGAPSDLPRKVMERFIDAQGKLEVEAIVFGHSHHPLVERQGDVLMVNPGSATDRFFAPYRSMAFLDVDQEIKADLLRL